MSAAYRTAEHKPGQLTAATACGLCLPRTLVTNSPPRARAWAAWISGPLIVKPIDTASIPNPGQPARLLDAGQGLHRGGAVAALDAAPVQSTALADQAIPGQLHTQRSFYVFRNVINGLMTKVNRATGGGRLRHEADRSRGAPSAAERPT